MTEYLKLTDRQLYDRVDFVAQQAKSMHHVQFIFWKWLQEHGLTIDWNDFEYELANIRTMKLISKHPNYAEAFEAALKAVDNAENL